MVSTIPARHPLKGFLSQTLEGLAEVAADPDPEAAPTEHVRAYTEAILLRASGLVIRAFPYGDLGSDVENGLDVDWKLADRRVRLVMPADLSRPPYVYHRQGDEYGVVDATPEVLAGWLDSLSQDA